MALGDTLAIKLRGDGRQYQTMLRQAEAQTKRFARSVTALGKTLTLKLTLPIVALGAASTIAFAKFDQAMIESTSIMKVTEDQVNSMRQTALDLAKEAPQGPAELAKSYFFLASAGLDAEKSIAALPVVSRFATAGAFDMALATDLLTDAQTALGLATGNTEDDLRNLIRISDVFVKANTTANTSVQQVAEAITADAGTAARGFGATLETTVAVLDAYASAGKKGAEAGNLFGRAVRLMTKSQRENAEVFDRLGIRVINRATGEYKNFIDIIGDMEVAFQDLTKPQRDAALEQLGFAALAQKAITPLIGLSGAMKDYERQLIDAGNETRKVAEKQMKSFSNQMRIAKNRATILAIEIGQQLAPIIEDLSKFLLDAVERWNNLSASTQKFIIRAAIAVAILGPLLLVVGTLISALGLLATAIKLVTVALAFLVLNPAVLIVVLTLAAIAGVALLLTGRLKDVADAAGVMWQEGVIATREFNKDMKKLKKGIEETQKQAKGGIDTQALTEGLNQQIAAADKEALVASLRGGEESKLDSAIKRINDDLKEQIGLLRNGADAWELIKLKELEASQADLDKVTSQQKVLKGLQDQKDATDKAIEATKTLTDGISDFTKNLQLQVKTFGLNSRQVEIFRLQQMGATDAQLAAARTADANLTKLEAEKKALEDTTRAVKNLIGGRDAAAAGSVEALSRIAEFTTGIGRTVKSNTGQVIAATTAPSIPRIDPKDDPANIAANELMRNFLRVTGATVGPKITATENRRGLQTEIGGTTIQSKNLQGIEDGIKILVALEEEKKDERPVQITVGILD